MATGVKRLQKVGGHLARLADDVRCLLYARREERVYEIDASCARCQWRRIPVISGEAISVSCCVSFNCRFRPRPACVCIIGASGRRSSASQSVRIPTLTFHHVDARRPWQAVQGRWYSRQCGVVVRAVPTLPPVARVVC